MLTEGVKLLKVCIVNNIILFQDCGVKTFLFLSQSITTITEPTIIYFIRPNPSLVMTVANNIRLLIEQEVSCIQFDSIQSTAKIYIFFFPCETRLLHELMQDLEVFQNVTTINTDISVYPLDDDILSLEISNCYSYNDLSIS